MKVSSWREESSGKDGHQIKFRAEVGTESARMSCWLLGLVMTLTHGGRVWLSYRWRDTRSISCASRHIIIDHSLLHCYNLPDAVPV
jgi:hypothetical protein